MSKGLEELYTDHANMRVLLQMLERELDRYRDGKIPDFELLQSMINDIIVFQNLVHHPKEDLVFARLIQREPIGAEPILDLLTDHARLAVVSRRFVVALHDIASGIEVRRDWFDQLLSEFLTAIRSHMNLEERKFFPRAADCLSDEDWLEIDAMMDKIKGLRISATIAETKLWLNHGSGESVD